MKKYANTSNHQFVFRFIMGQLLIRLTATIGSNDSFRSEIIFSM